MLHLPPNWKDLAPDATVRAIGETSRNQGVYPVLAAGLTFAYLTRCVGRSVCVERGQQRPFRNNVIFRVRDYEWLVLDDSDDRSCAWAAKALNPNGNTRVIAPFWAVQMVGLSLHRLTGAMVDTTTVCTLISLHVFFSSKGESGAERAALKEILCVYNRYCVECGQSSATIFL